MWSETGKSQYQTGKDTRANLSSQGSGDGPKVGTGSCRQNTLAVQMMAGLLRGKHISERMDGKGPIYIMQV